MFLKIIEDNLRFLFMFVMLLAEFLNACKLVLKSCSPKTKISFLEKTPGNILYHRKGESEQPKPTQNFSKQKNEIFEKILIFLRKQRFLR